MFPPQSYSGDNIVHLPTFDSAIRESLRLHPIFIKGLSRAVVRPEGLDIPLPLRIDNNNEDDNKDKHLHVSSGAWLGIPIRNVHLDERFYDNPETYDGFRTLRERQGRRRPNVGTTCRRQQRSHGSSRSSTRGEPENDECGGERDLDAGYPTPTYLGFGYGQHAWYVNIIIISSFN